jgi:hypothetical protein
MRNQRDILKRELQDIWLLLFGEPPSIEAEPALMASIIRQHLEPASPSAAPEARPD